jgi:hypothetical protein
MEPAPTPHTPPTHAQTDLSGWQRDKDLQHLKMLAIFHYIFGVLTLLGGCVGILYIVLGAFMAANPEQFTEGAQPPPPPFVGGMLVFMGACLMLVAWGMGVLIIVAGRCLANQRRRTFCIVIAAIMCLSFPLGTLLGVFTIIVLARPSVAALFAQRQAARGFIAAGI